MTDKELVFILIDKFTDLQRIKSANGGHENKELDYQIRTLTAQLSALGVSVEDITL